MVIQCYSNYTMIYVLLLQGDVMFRYFVLDSSVIIGVLEEPFVDDGMIYIPYTVKLKLVISIYVSAKV